MTSRRFSALVLLLALVAGGFGLPVADAVLYHSTPAGTPAHHTDDVALSTPTSSMHLQGCVIWLSALTGSGIGAQSPTLSVALVHTTSSHFTTPPFVVTQTDVSLGHSRAPPIA
jgi:hypothetical protein